MAVENYHLGFGFKLFFQVIKKDVVDLATLVPQSGLGSGKFIDNTTLMPNTNRVVQYGTGTDFKLFSGVPKSITNVEAAADTATLTFAAAHGIASGSVIVVEGLTGFTILHQIGLGPLVDGYAACHTNLLPFCL